MRTRADADERAERVLPAELVADYAAECAEHLTTVRRALLALEASVQDAPDGARLEELFRAFHSLKGLSGMVGLADAETLAHDMETSLRRLQQSPAPLTAADHAALADATRRLETLVAAVGAGGAPPEPEAPSAEPPRVGWRRVRVHYKPSAALAGRGVGINSVREALQALGVLVEAAPSIDPGGEIAFDFVLSTDAGDAALGALEADGIRWTVDTTPEAIAPPPAADDVRGGVAPSQFVRVDVARLDDLMRVMGDLVVTRSRLADALATVERHVPPALWRGAHEHTLAFERQLRELRDRVMRVRMVPIGPVFERMTFVARDLAREGGKHVCLHVHGARTEVDRFVVERLADPLLHLVRNAVSHGVEAADERRAVGKPGEATLTLRAVTAGDAVVIDVEDDGRGIDAAAVVDRARRAGLAVPPAPSADEVLDLLCAPGFSTRDTVDRGSGRGVGMTVVRRVVAEMGGLVTLASRRHLGTRFTIQLPLTLAITDALIASVGGRTFAVPQAAVREVLAVPADSVRRVETGELVAYRGGTLPLLRLARHFGLDATVAPSLHVFVAGGAEAPVGIAVDRIVGPREIVVHALSDQLVKVPGIAGATQLGDGQVVLILDVPVLLRTRARSAA